MGLDTPSTDINHEKESRQCNLLHEDNAPARPHGAALCDTLTAVNGGLQPETYPGVEAEQTPPNIRSEYSYSVVGSSFLVKCEAWDSSVVMADQYNFTLPIIDGLTARNVANQCLPANVKLEDNNCTHC